MENSRKLGKAPKRGRDRLRRLPEPIIYHILSFLDTKSAVQTSVLSRAWRCAWKHVPVLDLRGDSFKEYSSFVRFADKVLSLRYPLNLRKVTFDDSRSGGEREDYRLYVRVIEYAFSHKAQHFVVDLDDEFGLEEDKYEFSDLFGSVMSSNVETLELAWVHLDYKPSHYSGFRSLTTLNLNTCYLDDPGVLCDSNFPCLQNLVIENCDSYGYLKGSISGRHLLSLKLLPVPFLQFEICAPKLEFMSFYNFRGSPELSKLSVSSLEHAEIRVDRYFASGDIGQQHLISLFQDLRNAKSLTLHSETIQVLSKISGVMEQQPSPFTRLKHLNLQSKNVPYKVVNYFLKGSSNAEPHIEFLDLDERE